MMVKKRDMINQLLSRNKRGFTLVETILVVVILGVLLAIAIPNFRAARERVRRDMCINNLRQIELAKEQWALEHNKEKDDVIAGTAGEIAAALDPYLREDIWNEEEEECTTGHSLICPLDNNSPPTFGTSYTVNAIGANAVCKFKTADNGHRL